MLIEQALRTYMIGQSGITDLVSTRIHFVKAPQDIDKPYIVIYKISGPRLHSHDGGDGLAHPRFQVSIFAETYAAAKEIAAAIQSALQGYSGTMGGDGGVVVGNVLYEDENDFWEEQTQLYHVACDYILWHRE